MGERINELATEARKSAPYMLFGTVGAVGGLTIGGIADIAYSMAFEKMEQGWAIGIPLWLGILGAIIVGGHAHRMGEGFQKEMTADVRAQRDAAHEKLNEVYDVITSR